jgi:hypothetical protein
MNSATGRSTRAESSSSTPPSESACATRPPAWPATKESGGTPLGPARESGDGLLLRDTDRPLARLIGALLSEAGASSALFADAHPVALAIEGGGGGVVQTADPDDLGRLAAPSRTVVIEPLARSKGSPA